MRGIYAVSLCYYWENLIFARRVALISRKARYYVDAKCPKADFPQSGFQHTFIVHPGKQQQQ
jgi:hypothetical protein